MRISDWSSDVCSSGFPLHEARGAAARQQRNGIGHRIEQLLQPGLVCLGEVAQHVAVHQVLVAGMADAQAHAPELLADVSRQRADAVVAAGAAALLHADLAGREVDLVVEHDDRSEEHTSELQSLMRISYAVFCLKKKTQTNTINTTRL